MGRTSTTVCMVSEGSKRKGSHETRGKSCCLDSERLRGVHFVARRCGGYVILLGMNKIVSLASLGTVRNMRTVVLIKRAKGVKNCTITSILATGAVPSKGLASA